MLYKSIERSDVINRDKRKIKDVNCVKWSWRTKMSENILFWIKLTPSLRFCLRKVTLESTVQMGGDPLHMFKYQLHSLRCKAFWMSISLCVSVGTLYPSIICSFSFVLSFFLLTIPTFVSKYSSAFLSASPCTNLEVNFYSVGASVTRKKLPNIYKSCPKMISLEKW